MVEEDRRRLVVESQPRGGGDLSRPVSVGCLEKIIVRLGMCCFWCFKVLSFILFYLLLVVGVFGLIIGGFSSEKIVVYIALGSLATLVLLTAVYIAVRRVPTNQAIERRADSQRRDRGLLKDFIFGALMNIMFVVSVICTIVGLVVGSEIIFFFLYIGLACFGVAFLFGLELHKVRYCRGFWSRPVHQGWLKKWTIRFSDVIFLLMLLFTPAAALFCTFIGAIIGADNIVFYVGIVCLGLMLIYVIVIYRYRHVHQHQAAVPQVPSDQTIEQTDRNDVDHIGHDSSTPYTISGTFPAANFGIGGACVPNQGYTRSSRNNESNTDSSDMPRTAASDSSDVLRMAALMLNDRADQNEPPPPSYEDVMNEYTNWQI